MTAGLTDPLDDVAPPLELAVQAPPRRARVALIKRLADVVSLPSSRVNAFERAMTSDLLVEVLRDASTADRKRVAQRVAGLSEIPTDLLRMLICDEIEVAEPLLNDAVISAPDLIACAQAGTPLHRLAIALLRNPGAVFSQAGLELALSYSREHPALLAIMLKRPELRPAQAYVMFWWCGPQERKTILQRFAVGRDVLQDVASDVFALAAEEGWNDPLVRKALQFIERRQRNRSAQARSQFEDLEAAVDAASATGLTRQTAQEIGYLSGLKPSTAAKIFTDVGGEGLAVLCKATGLSKSRLLGLWRSMRRPEHTSDGALTPNLEHTIEAYDMMAVDRAQTVLRYWNWALSSSLSPALLRAVREGDEDALSQYSLPERAAFLAMPPRMSRYGRFGATGPQDVSTFERALSDVADCRT
eukprot:gene19144-19512_t